MISHWLGTVTMLCRMLSAVIRHSLVGYWVLLLLCYAAWFIECSVPLTDKTLGVYIGLCCYYAMQHRYTSDFIRV